MLDGLDVNDCGGYFAVQLKKLCKKSLPIQSGLYSCLALFSFGMLNIFPGLSQTGTSIPVLNEKPADMVEKIKENPEERCRLQADVALFLALRVKKNDALQTTVPCEKKPSVSAQALGKANGQSDTTLEDTVREMTAGYPAERMAPAIAKYERNVAALIVGIAKKESNWGKRVPLDANGADCFNYWGYKGAGSRGVAMGHGCFGSPEEAVTAIGDRLTKLVALRQTSEPKNMIIWKCGSSCQGHSAESVQKWIADVSLYYQRIATK